MTSLHFRYNTGICSLTLLWFLICSKWLISNLLEIAISTQSYQITIIIPMIKFVFNFIKRIYIQKHLLIEELNFLVLLLGIFFSNSKLKKEVKSWGEGGRLRKKFLIFFFKNIIGQFFKANLFILPLFVIKKAISSLFL